MSYLKSSDRVDCGNQERIAIVNRICLNLKLQSIDSIMISKYSQLLKKLNDSLAFKYQLEEHQNNWEKERKEISVMKSDGLTGNSEGIYYLNSMLILTKIRIKELEFILEELY